MVGWMDNGDRKGNIFNIFSLFHASITIGMGVIIFKTNSVNEQIILQTKVILEYKFLFFNRKPWLKAGVRYKTVKIYISPLNFSSTTIDSSKDKSARTMTGR